LLTRSFAGSVPTFASRTMMSGRGFGLRAIAAVLVDLGETGGVQDAPAVGAFLHDFHPLVRKASTLAFQNLCAGHRLLPADDDAVARCTPPPPPPPPPPASDAADGAGTPPPSNRLIVDDDSDEDGDTDVVTPPPPLAPAEATPAPAPAPPAVDGGH
jgi:hypothetical protein